MNESDSSTPDPTVELQPNTHEMVVQYNRDDETFAETLERLIMVFVPNTYELDKRTNYSGETVDEDSRFVLERWPDTDNYVGTYMYKSKTAYLRAHADMVASAVHGDAHDRLDELETDGGSE